MRGPVLVMAACLVAAGCSTGSDAVANGTQFQFVSPGGQTTILYDPPVDRGEVPALEGESLAEPGVLLSTADWAGDVIVLNVWGSVIEEELAK